jgi:MOSC domain-containing protein YiiM
VSAKVLSVQVGLPKVYATPSNDPDDDREWESGIFKAPIEGPIWAGETNLAGDGQSDLVHHGGSDRAILLFGHSHYPLWSSRLGRALEFGSFGENLTVEGLTEDDVCLGDIWAVGEVELEISQPRIPCYKMSRRLDAPGLHLQVMQEAQGGWYARVVRQGFVGKGASLTLQSRPNPSWTVRRGFQTYMHKADPAVLAELGVLPCLSQLWIEGIARRLQVSV